MISPPVCKERDLEYGGRAFESNRALSSLKRLRCLAAAVKQVVG